MDTDRMSKRGNVLVFNRGRDVASTQKESKKIYESLCKKFSGTYRLYLRYFEAYLNKWREDLKRTAENNPEGFTEDFGFTFTETKPPFSGYVVGLTNKTLDYWLKISPDKLARYVCYVKSIAEAYKLSPSEYEITIGGWLDRATNTYYVDVGMNIHNREIALDIARIHDQKAIFNLDTMESIDVV